MDDSFAFGEPSRKRGLPKAGKTRAPKAPKASTGSGRGRVAILVLAGVVVVVIVAAFMSFMKGSGEQVASDEQTAISQVGVAKDVDAQMSVQQAVTAVQELYAEQGSYAGVTAAALTRFEPAYSYTSGSSTGPKSVAVASSANGVGLAVLSPSGTCFYLHFAGSVRYGTGSTCTGAAAMTASAAGWPTS